MSQSVVDLLEDQSVVASLQPGPKGMVRLSYEYAATIHSPRKEITDD
jgi:hypothetical protein